MIGGAHAITPPCPACRAWFDAFFATKCARLRLAKRMALHLLGMRVPDQVTLACRVATVRDNRSPKSTNPQTSAAVQQHITYLTRSVCRSSATPDFQWWHRCLPNLRRRYARVIAVHTLSTNFTSASTSVTDLADGAFEHPLLIVPAIIMHSRLCDVSTCPLSSQISPLRAHSWFLYPIPVYSTGPTLGSGRQTSSTHCTCLCSLTPHSIAYHYLH